MQIIEFFSNQVKYLVLIEERIDDQFGIQATFMVNIKKKYRYIACFYYK